MVQIDLTRRPHQELLADPGAPGGLRLLDRPGFEPDLLVEADSVALHRVWVGQLGLEQALREGLIEIDGPDELRRAFPGLLKLSLFVERQAMREPPGIPVHSPS